MSNLSKKDNQLESSRRHFDKTDARKLGHILGAHQKKIIYSNEYISFVVPWQRPLEKGERKNIGPV